MTAPSDEPENSSEPGDEPVIEPAEPWDPEADLDDGEVQHATTSGEAHVARGQFGPSADSGDD